MTEQEKKIKHDREFIAWATKKDARAMTLLDMLGDALHCWDDLVDNDNPELTTGDIDRVYWNLLIEIPQNEFYIEFQSEFIPVFRESVRTWWEANRLEQNYEYDPDALPMAYALRTMYNMILTTTAYLIGGVEWMREVSQAMHCDFSMKDGTFHDYVLEKVGK